MSLQLSLSDPPDLNDLFSQIPYVLILLSSPLRLNLGGHGPNVFYYLLINQASMVREFKHLMFLTAEYTGTGDTSSGLCMFLFGCIIVDTFTQIPEESCRRQWLHLRVGESHSHSSSQSSGDLCPHKQCKHMQIIRSSKYQQAFIDVSRSHIVTFTNEAQLVFMFGIKNRRFSVPFKDGL